MTNFKWNMMDIMDDFQMVNNKMALPKNSRNISLYCDVCRLKSLLKKYPKIYLKNFTKGYYPHLKRQYEKIFNKEFEYILNIIINNIVIFRKLFSKIANADFDMNVEIPLDTIAIDNELVNCLRSFFGNYNHNLLLYFEQLYNNHNINIEDFVYDEYAGECINISSLNKQYINIYSRNIVPDIIHEVSHAYEFRIEKDIKSWFYDINLYNESFAIITTLIGDEYFQGSNYFLSAIIDKFSFLQTIYILANNLYYELMHGMTNFSLSDFIYAYDANIAMALVEQYQNNPKEAKKNIDYYLNNSSTDFSNKLLKSIDIDLNRLYSGDYYLEYYKSTKETVKKLYL
ncbi:MAG: hypothetical protein HFI86_01505 [Bacilli bacterium]|nr:hypothetical protein [Bacilli bacterium]